MYYVVLYTGCRFTCCVSSVDACIAWCGMLCVIVCFLCTLFVCVHG